MGKLTSEEVERIVEIYFHSNSTVYEQVKLKLRQVIQEVVGIEPDKPLPYFHDVKVGDEVVDTFHYELTFVVGGHTDMSNCFCFQTANGHWWNKKGELCSSSNNKQLLFYPSDPNLPKIRVKKKVEIKRQMCISKDYRTSDGYCVTTRLAGAPTDTYIAAPIITIPFEIEEER